MTAERRPGAAVPPTHAALLDAPLNAVLTTHLPTGRLHSSVVWFWRDGACVYVSTMAEFRKARNMRARPRATLLVTESGGPGRWVELRADVVPVPGDGTSDLDAVVADPRATLLVIDPADGSRWMEIRADAELVTDGAVAVLDQLTADYTGLPHYYGGVAPADLADRETRVTVRLRPQRIVCDAIHR